MKKVRLHERISIILFSQAMVSDEAEAALCLGACKEAQAAYTVFVTVIGDFKANR